MNPLVPKRPEYDAAHAQRIAQHIETAVFLYDIVATADRLRTARAFDGSTPLRFDRRYALLRAIERCGGGPSFSDLARLLRVTRQTAREQVLTAEKAGVVELFVDPHDRRVVRVALTQRGRRVLEAGKLPEVGWLFTLLNGFETAALQTTAKVLYLIRERLDGHAAEMRRAADSNRRERRRE